MELDPEKFGAYLYSSYYMDILHGWVATHRLPLNQAIHFAQLNQKQRHCLTAIVPDHADPMPYLRLVEETPAYIS